MRISKHFARYEIACRCGCGFDSMDAETLMVADMVREFVGKPVSVNSGARCEKHNRLVGGSPYSQHLLARAMDLKVEDPLEVYNFLCEKFPRKYGIGLYQGFVHIDTRTHGPARWYG